MQAASAAYKQEMKKQLRDHSYMRVTIGVINQEAQASANIEDAEDYTYYSSLRQPFDNYKVSELYETCDQDYTMVDGSMYFLPREREDVVLNQGIVTEQILGQIEIHFPVCYDIKGLTVEFGKAYPVEFSIVSDNTTLDVTENESSHYVTETVFAETTFLRFIPKKMVNGKSRFRINQITMGIGIYFDGQKILSATKKEHISPIMEDLPSLDLSVTIDNKNRAYDIENDESTINFLENGQEIGVSYGQELEDGSIEWMPGATAYLSEWSADDTEMSFTATDRFDKMDGTYWNGRYYLDGITLYDLAVDVFTDAGIDSRTYWLDNYLKDVKICNPMPVVTHKEALQLIANAARCILYQDRKGNIFMKSSFIPEMNAESENETYFSSVNSILKATEKVTYATSEKNHTDVVSTMYFLSRNEAEHFLDTGYVSEAVADENGAFQENPCITVYLEARYKCFGLTLEFGANVPSKMIFHSYLAGELQEDFTVDTLSETMVISHEFPEFDQLVFEFLEGMPHSRVTLKNVKFGDSTDYELSYGEELTRTPKGTQLEKVKELQITRTMYGMTEERVQLTKETITMEAGEEYTFYFTNASYNYEVDSENGTFPIVDSSAYYVTIKSHVSDSVELVITGYEYKVMQSMITRQLHTTGKVETWKNPLISSIEHAWNLAKWIGDYMCSDRDYELSYRGEPRIDANDIAFLENKYVPDLLLRVYEHTLKFNGALSGTMKARRDMSRVERTKNRLERKRFF